MPPCFQNFSQQTPNCHALIFSKNVNSVITILFYGQKKLIRCLFFFLIFARENCCSHAHIISKRRLFSKSHPALKPIFREKTSILSKDYALMLFFFSNFYENPCCQAHIWSKNFNSVKTTVYFVSKKLLERPFFLFLYGK